VQDTSHHSGRPARRHCSSREETCHFCDALLASDNIEYDHFPVPRRAGGTEVVAACITCHDMKDRFLQEDWPRDLLNRALDEARRYQVSEMSRAGIPNEIGKLTPDGIKAVVDIAYSWPQHVLKNWSEYSREARLIAAKSLALDADLHENPLAGSLQE
jgi:hypothetical protein